MKYRFLLLLISFLLTILVKAQDIEFWMSPISELLYVHSIYGLNGGFMISNPSNKDATVKIHYNQNETEEIITIKALGYGLKKYSSSFLRDRKLEVTTMGDIGVPIKAGAHITSDVPVFIYYIFDYRAIQETIVLKGGGSLGTAFTVGHAEGNINPRIKYGSVANYPFISIMASEDHTTVNFSIPNNVTNYTAGKHSVILNKGESIILRSNLISGSPLKGSQITSDKPISVISGEELFGTTFTGDLCADQLIQDSYARQTYVLTLSAGYHEMTNFTNRELVCNYLDITGLEDNTEVFINWGKGRKSLGTINRGQTLQTDTFHVSRKDACATITSTKPIHCQQIAGREASVCHLPNFYATRTNYISFFSYMQNEDLSYGPIYPAMMLVYEKSGKNDIKIKYQGQDFVPLFDWISSKKVYVDSQGSVPEFPDWNYIRLTLPPDARNQIVTVQSTSSVFQLGFMSTFYAGTNLSYFSAYKKHFQFTPETVYKCPGATYTLIGGIGEYYKWIYPDGTIRSGRSLNRITVSAPGLYTLVMQQGDNEVTMMTTIVDIVFNAEVSPKKVFVDKNEVVTYSVNHFIPPSSLQIRYKWNFGEGAVPTTSTDASPTVSWSTRGIKTVSLSISAQSTLLENMGCDTLIVEKAYVNMNITPVKQDKCINEIEQMTCSFTLSGGPNTYQWQSSKDNQVWVNIQGAKAVSYTPTNLKRGITYYRVVVNDGTETVVSLPAIVRARSCALPVNHNISVVE